MCRQQRTPFTNFASILIAGGIFLSTFASPSVARGDEKPEPKGTQLMMINADGTGLREIFSSEDFPSLGSPAFSPDGKQIAMDGWKSQNGETFSKAHILVINSDGTNFRDLGDGAMPSWSADGKQVTFSRYSPRSGVWKMNIDGSNQELIENGGWGAQWSPDGKLIAFSDYGLGEANLKIYDIEEDTFRYIFAFNESPYSRYYWNMCWSPDSQSLCFKGQTKARHFELATVNIDQGKKSWKVHYSDPKKQPGEDVSWHPDGKQILCTLQSPEFKTRKIFIFNPLTKDKPVVVPGQTFDESPGSACWSPDGKKLIFTIK